MLRDVACERHGEVKAQCQIGVALGKAVNLLFGLASRLGKQHRRVLDHRRVERQKAEALVHRANGIVHFVEQNLVGGQKLHRPLQRAGFYFFGHTFISSVGFSRECSGAELVVVQFFINAVGAHQFLVRAALANALVGHDDDFVRALDG